MISKVIKDRPFLNLQGGWPSPRLHPVDALRASTASVFQHKQINKQLLYGPEHGSLEFRESVGRWLFDFYAPSSGPISGDRIIISNGASNGLATILQKFTDPRSTRGIWMIEPTYFLACPVFRDAGFCDRIRGVPEGDDGVDIAFLANALQQIDDAWQDDSAKSVGKFSGNGYPKIYRHVIYLIPTFSNPSGITMSLETRRSLVRLARMHDALIITDDVYDMLRWPKEPELSLGDMAPPPPRLVDVDREMHGTSHFGNTVSNGSFSKIVAPGLRVGWLEATPAFIQAMGTVGATVSGGCQSHFASLAVYQLLLTGELEQHIEKVLIPTYRKRYYAMVNAIKEKLCPLGVRLIGEDQARENGVAGGFFLYLTFNGCAPGIGGEVSQLAQNEFSLKIPAGRMYAVPDDPSSVIREEASYFNGTRLCWAWHELDDIVESIDRLAEAISCVKAKHAKGLPESSVDD
ncbi:hypothetical protein LCI18_014054 [Fusarium solani-melongenae]|uniref:Uncharacterized protein n=1 Tax=Fusarium solani subsp. cucurbitae TaxID=2747967 RepID=A0ACD3ZP41_FUSSC|nr:hypothetical protein LCI18_014054 [Fusarium solani-melongenae]